jgi:hypothetical protein
MSAALRSATDLAVRAEGVPFDNEVNRVRQSGVLGESRLRRLFDYLVSYSQADKSPKEICIAIDVFDKDASFDVSRDSLVRVYVHKLRRVLDDFYRSEKTPNVLPIFIPRGQYRLQLKEVQELSTSVPSETAPPRGEPRQDAQTDHSYRQWRTWGTWALIFLAGLCAGALAVRSGPWTTGSANMLERVQADPLWADMLADSRPLVIVLGDYYLIGETTPTMDVVRLIREFSVNSSDQLDQFLERHPELAPRYTDLGLRYLPTSSAFALRNLVPVLSGAKRPVAVMLASEVTPITFKSADIVYVGYLSGLGFLQRTIFSGSRFTIGESYDELKDSRTGEAYISETADILNTRSPASLRDKGVYRDYGYIAKLTGPSGNHIVAIAGTRDEGVRQSAEAITNPDKLSQLRYQVDPHGSFETLLEVLAEDGVNLSGRILLTTAR